MFFSINYVIKFPLPRIIDIATCSLNSYYDIVYLYFLFYHCSVMYVLRKTANNVVCVVLFHLGKSVKEINLFNKNCFTEGLVDLDDIFYHT